MAIPCELNGIARDTYKMLHYLAKENIDDKVNIEYMYMKINQLNNLKKIMPMDIFKAININPYYEIKRDELVLQCNKLDEFFEEFKKALSDNRTDKTKVISDVFKKAGIRRVTKLNREKLTKGTKESDPYEEIIKFDELEVNNIVEKLLLYDYVYLDNAIKMNNLSYYDIEEENCLNKVYTLYSLGRDKEAYALLKQLSERFFKSQKYYMFMISEFNRYYFGKGVMNGEIMEETKKIDLNRLFLKLPESNRETLAFLRDIISFNFVYVAIKKAVDFNIKVEEEKDTNYVGVAQDCNFFSVGTLLLSRL